jgi:hypothetical protein
MPLAARAFDISTPSHSLSPGARRSLSLCTFGERRREKKIGKGSSERVSGRRIIIVRSNPITGAAPKDMIIFVCARESEIEKGSQSHTGLYMYMCGRKEIELDADFVLAGKTPHTHTYMYICASSSLFGFALGRNGDVSRTKALAAQHARKSLSLCATERVCCRFN